MNEEGRKKRDREIVTLFRAGNRPVHIAELYGLEAVQVRRIIHAAGHEIERADGYDHSNVFWDRPTPDLREAIWERQREGARQALRSFSPTIHIAHT